MSLLSNPRHRIDVQPYKVVPGSIGQDERVPDGLPFIGFRCNVHLLSSTEIVNFGVRDFVDGSITATTWPWGEYARITYNGVEYDQDGAAILKDMSRRTRHYEVQIRKRNKKAGTP